MLDGCPDIDLVHQAATASQAYEFLSRETVDIVLLDHEMPGQKGLDALPRMMELAGDAHIVMLSTHCQRGSKTAVAALSLGATDALAKPSKAHAAAFSETLVSRLRQIGRSRRVAQPRLIQIAFRPVPADFSVGCIAIGASTGGIYALSSFFSALTVKPGVPILVTQHLPEPFIPYYVQQVARMTGLPVSMAVEDEVLRPDHVYVAPGDASLGCRKGGGLMRVSLNAGRDPETQARPSVNHMFATVADCYGPGVLGIILTGIGRDGTAGARRIVGSGGVVIAQDRESSVVWGMPGSVARAGLASATMRPDDIPGFLADHCGAPR